MEELRRATVLVVDDQDDQLNLLVSQLRRQGCDNVHAVSDPFLAAEVHRRVRPDLVLLDYRLPPVDGFFVLEQIWEGIALEFRTPVIMITAGATEEVCYRALEMGVNDFLEHPSNPLELVLRVRNALRTHLLYQAVHQQMLSLDEMVRLRTNQLESARAEILERLALAAEFRDDATGAHARRVGMISRDIAREIGADPVFVQQIEGAALLHDLGKIGIRDSVLLKAGKLTCDEFEHVKSHTIVGAKILDGCTQPVLMMAREIALTHHERWDGNGYPHQLKAERIPLSGRIVSVADAYDAMITDRPYKDALPVESALQELVKGRGTQFDPNITDAFLSCARRSMFYVV